MVDVMTPYQEASRLLSLIEEDLSDRYQYAEQSGRWDPELEVWSHPKVESLMATSGPVRVACVIELVRRRDTMPGAFELLPVLLRKQLALSADDLEEVLNLLHDESTSANSAAWIADRLISHIERSYRELESHDQARIKPLARALARARSGWSFADQLHRLILERDEIPFVLLGGLSSFAEPIREVFETSNESAIARSEMLGLLMSWPRKARTTHAWRLKAEGVYRQLKEPETLAMALLDAALLGVADLACSLSDQADLSSGKAESLLRGVVAIAGVTGEDPAPQRLRQLAIKCLAISNSYGCEFGLPIANACVAAMAEAGGGSAVTELLALERSVRHGTVLRQIRTAIEKLAAARGLTRDELLELAVEAHGLDRDGTRQIPLSRGAAVIATDGRSVLLGWRDDTGVSRKTFPADVKASDADLLTALRSDVKAIRTTLAGERNRFDELIRADRVWRYEEWRARYRDHPVTGRLVSSVIWRFRIPDAPVSLEVIGMPTDNGGVLNASGQHCSIPSDAEVRLWHPIDAAPDDLRAWRRYLVDQQIPQPIKQAFREVYVPTPAEHQTQVYSHRFAGHVFGQVRARALLKGRGWKPVPVAWWDDGIDHGFASRVLPRWGISAEFFFDPILDIHPDSGDLYPYCASDQVRFVGDDDTPLELADVPPLAFTEVMRDIDLVIGVTSIGADPAWLDRDEGPRFERYWNGYGFGELGPSAQIRQEVLASLLPRLAIADRCRLDGRFLVVRGDLRTYRIHLGSGNILMSPNDQYLCIVSTQDRQAEQVFLPFDDDALLSLILSKAFLLANDTTIADPSIRQQIHVE
jgi:Domain of unknown function (DUF4132)